MYILKKIHSFNQYIGKFVGILSICIMALITMEVILRYFFKSPTTWNKLINSQVFGVFVLYSGVYAMSHHAHLRIEMLYERFPPKLRLFSRIISFAGFCFFMVCLIWQGVLLGWLSFQAREIAVGAFPMPLYPLKLLMPLIAFIFLLEGIVVMFLPKD